MAVAKINGVEERVESGATIFSYLDSKGYNKASVIVEYNFTILKSELWEETTINDKDNIEILSFVGGG